MLVGSYILDQVFFTPQLAWTGQWSSDVSRSRYGLSLVLRLILFGVGFHAGVVAPVHFRTAEVSLLPFFPFVFGKLVANLAVVIKDVC